MTDHAVEKEKSKEGTRQKNHGEKIERRFRKRIRRKRFCVKRVKERHRLICMRLKL